MALRFLGSSLVAKAASGSKTRDLAEANISQPEIPGKANVGSFIREAVEQPLERPVPQGSSKVVASQPLIEGGAVTSLPGSDAGAIREGMGIGVPGSRVTPYSPPVAPGGAGQALFQGGVSPAAPNPSQPQQAPAAPTSRVNPGVAATSISRPSAPSQPSGQVLGASSGSSGSVLRSQQGSTPLRSNPQPSPSPSPKPVQAQPSFNPLQVIQSILNSLFGGTKSVVQNPKKGLRSLGFS